MERDKLICVLIGKYTALNPSITAENLRISIDQHLSNCNMLPLGKDDNNLLEDVIGETMMSVLSSGINRKQRRVVLHYKHNVSEESK